MSVSSFRSTSTVNDLIDVIQSQASYPKLKYGIQSRDFTRENIIRVRLLSAKKPENERKKTQPMKADWKTNKYEHVKAKISTFPTVSSSKNEDLDDILGVTKPKVPQLKLNQENEDPKMRRRPSSTVEDVGIVKTSYVKENAVKAKFTPLKRCNSASDLDGIKNRHLPGFVPKYLIERKKQLVLDKEREREKKVNENKLRCYNGHVLMSDEERLGTLKQMRENERKLLEKLSSMPINLGTLRLRREKEEIEQQLAKLEEGIKIFSRTKVYIKND